ncbi:hypothetical protein ACEPPO_00790 (plasmid) [Limosilactobacillus fermentum]
MKDIINSIWNATPTQVFGSLAAAFVALICLAILLFWWIDKH